MEEEDICPCRAPTGSPMPVCHSLLRSDELWKRWYRQAYVRCQGFALKWDSIQTAKGEAEGGVKGHSSQATGGISGNNPSSHRYNLLRDNNIPVNGIKGCQKWEQCGNASILRKPPNVRVQAVGKLHILPHSTHTSSSSPCVPACTGSGGAITGGLARSHMDFSPPALDDFNGYGEASAASLERTNLRMGVMKHRCQFA